VFFYKIGLFYQKMIWCALMIFILSCFFEEFKELGNCGLNGNRKCIEARTSAGRECNTKLQKCCHSLPPKYPCSSIVIHYRIHHPPNSLLITQKNKRPTPSKIFPCPHPLSLLYHNEQVPLVKSLKKLPLQFLRLSLLLNPLFLNLLNQFLPFLLLFTFLRIHLRQLLCFLPLTFPFSSACFLFRLFLLSRPRCVLLHTFCFLFFGPDSEFWFRLGKFLKTSFFSDFVFECDGIQLFTNPR
jgi:hypothetical protein